MTAPCGAPYAMREDAEAHQWTCEACANVPAPEPLLWRAERKARALTIRLLEWPVAILLITPLGPKIERWLTK